MTTEPRLNTVLHNLKEAGFPKCERIVSKKLMDELFENGHSHSLTVFPLRAIYMSRENESIESWQTVTQVLVSVSKRHFKHAVDRNRVKRQVREAYRQNKQLLWSSIPENRQVFVAFIWLSDELMPSSRVTRSVKTILTKIGEKTRR